MSRPRTHKRRILKYLNALKEELRNIYIEKHVEYPKISIDEVESNIKDICEEIERVGLVE